MLLRSGTISNYVPKPRSFSRFNRLAGSVSGTKTRHRNGSFRFQAAGGLNRWMARVLRWARATCRLVKISAVSPMVKTAKGTGQARSASSRRSL